MLTPYDTSLPPDLRALKERIEDYARGYGLDFYETIFEVIDADDLNEIAAYGGFPTRYPHWSFGMSYEELKKGYDYGLSKIYEMVINNDPCYAYLMRCNHTLDQKLVMAHVYGHCDFFKNNAYFAHTSRKMMDEMANHGARIRGYVEKYGEDEVEQFMDRCMSIDDLIDIHSTAIRRRAERSRYDFAPEREDVDRATRFKAKDYMDEHINPRRLLQQEEDSRRKAQEQQERRFPEQPEKDILLFLIENAPLKNWQRDVLSIIRDEAYYFMPQAQTKIMNEGWACLSAGSLLFTESGLVPIEDVVEKRFRGSVCDGEQMQRVYDHARFENREIMCARTRRGLEVEGSITHRLLMSDGSWKRLDELKPGDRVQMSGGLDRWKTEYVEVCSGLEKTGHLLDDLKGATVVDEKVGAALGRTASKLEEVPEVILRSPRSVVAAFLRAYYDCDGHAGNSGIILSTFSESLGKVTQLLLLNFGILSHRRRTSDGGWHVHTTGASAERFAKEIGFGLQRQKDTLDRYLSEHQWFKTECWDDEIVSIEHRGTADVYDISVENSHRYAAQGLINHNSYWHSTIMTEKALEPSEVIDYADHHSGTMAMSGGRLNPYKLGIELFRDIEQRWNTGRFGKEFDECDDLDKRKSWDKKLGLGRKKIFEVRKIYNDITFIDTFLTPEFCVQHNLFSFAYQEQAGVYYIDSRDFEQIKQRLLSSLTNFGKPWIYVVDGNYRNRGELMLMHKYNGVELRLDHAADTLANIQSFWGRPVHLQTVVDDTPTVLSFDGQEHDIQTGGEIDDVRGDSEE